MIKHVQFMVVQICSNKAVKNKKTNYQKPKWYLELKLKLQLWSDLYPEDIHSTSDLDFPFHSFTGWWKMEKRPRLMSRVGEPGQKCESESASSSVLLDPLRARATLCSLPGPSVHGIFQVRILEWVAISFSRDLSHPGIKPVSPALQADSLLSEPPGEPPCTKLNLKALHFYVSMTRK